MYEYVEQLNSVNNFGKVTKIIASVLVVALCARYHNITNMSKTVMEWTQVGIVAATVDSSTGNSAMLHPSIEGGEHTISLKIKSPQCSKADIKNKARYDVHVNTKLIAMNGACVGGGYMVLSPNTYKDSNFLINEFKAKKVVNVVANDNWVGSFGTNGYKITERRVKELARYSNNTIKGKTLASVWIK